MYGSCPLGTTYTYRCTYLSTQYLDIKSPLGVGTSAGKDKPATRVKSHPRIKTAPHLSKHVRHKQTAAFSEISRIILSVVTFSPIHYL